jgi:predicted nucleic acid-binding protein
VATRSRRARPTQRRATRRQRLESPAGSLRYVESSALVAALLEHDLSGFASSDQTRYVTSALTFAQTGRAIIRARAAGRLTEVQEQAAVKALQTFERRCFVVDIDAAVLNRVRRPFPIEPIRTLDAVHLATADLLGEPPALLTIVTRDARVRDNARALGYPVA